MAEQSGGEKTLPASPHKREKARNEGRVAKSQDLTSAVAMLVALMALRYFGPGMFNRQVNVLQYYLSDADKLTAEVVSFQSFTIQGLLVLAMILGPLVLMLLVAGVASNMLQVGFLFTGKPLMPKLEKLNIFTGFANLFNTRSAMELVKSVLKVVICGYIVWLTLQNRTMELVVLMELSPMELVPAVGALVFALWWRIVLAMLVLGILDYAFQYWQYERDMMMTFQEAKEEMREFEGDPRVRQRVRQIQRQLAMQRMMRDVPKADVVITNPTEFAVALRYDASTMAAPVVVAKGARLVAERIRDLAIRHDVPLVQKPELARAIYRTMDVGGAIPDNLFRAVAEVLAYVYRIDRREEKIQERNKVNA